MILYTTETIYHYTCEECKNWWSYATIDAYDPEFMICPHCGHEDAVDVEQREQRMRQPIEWISVEDELPVAPIGRVHVMVDEEFIGQGMPREPIKMLRMGDYTDDFCEQGESGYWQDDYGNRIEVEREGGVYGDVVTHWARQIPGPIR